MRKTLVAVVATVVLVAAAGCGSSSTSTITKTVTAPTPKADSDAAAAQSAAAATTSTPVTATTTTTSSTPSGPPQCSDVTDKPDVRPILCINNGNYLRVATDDHPVHITGVTVGFSGARTASSVSDSSGVASATASGTFLILTLHVTNTNNSPQAVESPGNNQFALSPIGSNKTFTENFEAENQADENSFLSHDDPLQPDGEQTGDIVFDIPGTDLAKMRRVGAVLTFTSLGGDLSEVDPGSPHRALGAMIIYHRDLL
jgi:hypothetical protein